MNIVYTDRFLRCVDLTLASPAVMFCRAPMAASRLVELLSLFCRTSLYSATTLGCHSHSAPLGCRDTSDSMDRFWLRCRRGGERERKVLIYYIVTHNTFSCGYTTITFMIRFSLVSVYCYRDCASVLRELSVSLGATANVFQASSVASLRCENDKKDGQ